MRDFSREQILMVLDAAKEIKKAFHHPGADHAFKEKQGRAVRELLDGVMVGSLFIENSTRTNYSCRAAAMLAGAYVDGFSSIDTTSLKKGETWADTAAMFAGYGYEAIIMRSTVEGLPRWTKEYLEMNHNHLTNQHETFGSPFTYRRPMIINGGDGRNQHPTQCFLDLLTMAEVAESKGKSLEGLEIALMNDIAHSRVLSSLLSVAPEFGFKIHLAYPQRFGPREHQLADLKRLNVTVYDHQEKKEEAMREADIAYHTRPQKERVGKGEDLEAIKKWGMITKDLYDQLGKNAPYLMHALPVDSETFQEIHHSMRGHPKNLTQFQAANGLYVRLALLALGLGRMNGQYDDVVAANQDGLRIEKLPLSQKSKNLAHAHSGYIQDQGIVLDHLPAGLGRRLEGVLGFEQEGLELVASYNLKVADGRKLRKDMIKIHGSYQLSTQQLQALALIAPEVTISIVSNGAVREKLRPVLGNYIENLVDCGNDNCVTNVRIEAVTPKHHLERNSGSLWLRCDYCETPDTLLQAYAQKRFRYLDNQKI